MNRREARYLKTLVDPIRVCAQYRPRMGQRAKAGVDLEAFRRLYQADPFYHWLGLDNPLMYAAHKAAGGMTSIYRQIGIGGEALFREILRDSLGLSAEQVKWSYAVGGAGGKLRRLALDARMDCGDVRDSKARERIANWLAEACQLLDVDPKMAAGLQGAVFEVRQGYKSKDSKRQNADLANAATAYIKAYLPCVSVFSMQIDEDIADRYANGKWLVLRGIAGEESPLHSTYAFFKNVVGFDLQAFFERSSKVLRKELDQVLRALLSTE